MRYTLDEFDLRLLHALQHDAQLTSSDLSNRVHLSASQCQRRTKRLQEQGFISGYTALLDRERLGLRVLAIVNVSLEKHGKQTSEKFNKHIQQFPNVLECWTTTGESDYVMKVVARDLKSFSTFLMDEFLALSMVASVKSSILLQEIKATTRLPISL